MGLKLNKQMTMVRRTMRVVTCGLIFFWAGALLGNERVEVNMAFVREKARQLAQMQYHPPAHAPAQLRKLTYDQHRDIRFNPNRALWGDGGSPFRLQFYHPGYLFNHPVRINEFTATHTQPVRFVTDFFDYGSNDELRRSIPASLGYAGFRIHYPLNTADVYDELAVFLGASYFRVLGRNQIYGISARGLALNSSLSNEEEFPIFREFWLGKPASDASQIQLYALLDSPSVSGAYQFTIRPGVVTEMAVEATLYFREEVDVVGLAPFSSMFFFGENTLESHQDYRPEVHDSDGLLIEEADGSRIWRPLVNEVRSRYSIFQYEQPPLGFGLRQRDREFASYQDIEARYHDRPSVWVTPGEGWGSGEVHLIEHYTINELMDNVVTFWKPDDIPAPGEPWSFSYAIYWETLRESDLAHVHSTRSGININDPQLYEFVVDFKGEAIAKLPNVEAPEVEVSVEGDAKLTHYTLLKNEYEESWRVVLYVMGTVEGDGVAELTLRLKNDQGPLSEIWSYQWIY